MKNLILILLLTIHILPATSFAWNEKSISIQGDNIEAVKSHTAHHETIGARNIALIKLTGLTDGCTKGVFFDSTENKTTFSLALAAMASKNNIRVAYDVDQRSPWGDSAYCALSSIEFEK